MVYGKHDGFFLWSYNIIHCMHIVFCSHLCSVILSSCVCYKCCYIHVVKKACFLLIVGNGTGELHNFKDERTKTHGREIKSS